MNTLAEPAKRLCIYCGELARGISRGEHVVPEAIGGAVTLKDRTDNVVCRACNNEVLSVLDTELCSRSYLSIIASQEIGAHIWQTWDVDEAAGNLLVEAKPSWKDGELAGMICYPQLTFESNGPELRGDAEEMERFGRKEFESVFLTAVRNAFERYRAGKRRALNPQTVRSDIKSLGYRFPPRVYTPHSITEIAQKVKTRNFNLRYVAPEDLQYALQCLTRLDTLPPFKNWKPKISSRVPTISQFFDKGLTMRGLMKLGMNLLAAYCTKTPINRETFKEVVRLIRGEYHPNDVLYAFNGFVNAADIQEINPIVPAPQVAQPFNPSGPELAKPTAVPLSHCFRLVHHDQHWLVYSSFFGGRIGTVVALRGPSYEDWNSMDIVAPIGAKEWPFTKYSMALPLRVHVEWDDITRIAPSLKFQRVFWKSFAEEARPSKKA